MQVTLVIGPPFSRLLGSERLTLELGTDSCDVGFVLDAMQKASPGFRDRLLDRGLITNGRLTAVIVVNGRLASLDSRVEEGSEIKVLSSMSGG